MEKAKQWAAPLIVGIVLGMIILSFGFGFMSGGSAQDLADDQVEAKEDALAEVLVPYLTQECAANAQADPDGLAEVMAKSSYQQRQAISDTGWVTYPEGASSSLTRAIDQGCLDALEG